MRVFFFRCLLWASARHYLYVFRPQSSFVLGGIAVGGCALHTQHVPEQVLTG